VPFVVRWPGKIKGGQKTNALACLTDLYDTMRELTEQPTQDQAGEDSFSLMGVFKGAEQSKRESLVSHAIGGAFAIRKGDWKLCLCAGSGGWSEPREPQAKKQNLPLMQLYNLKSDRGEENNLLAEHPEKVAELLKLLEKQVTDGRCTPGNPVANDRDVTFLPEGVEMPAGEPVPST